MTNMPRAVWSIGDRLYDATFQKRGRVTEVVRFGPSTPPVLTVAWEDGGYSDFTPDENTHGIADE